MEANHPVRKGAFMPKNRRNLPPALKHGIYSGIGLLPTENSAKFRKFRREIFDELALVGRLETDLGDVLVRLLWRRQNLFTYRFGNARAKSTLINPFRIEPVRTIVAGFASVRGPTGAPQS
jgi:hypothetical protein